jgi:hypothetical protein
MHYRKDVSGGLATMTLKMNERDDTPYQEYDYA